jgi:serine/threonine-protein kinase
VLDFGLAKSMAAPGEGGVTRPGSVMGTPAYMSPEQVRGGREVDYRADLWSLGVIACECLTGLLPFEGESFAGLALAICAEVERPRPSELGAVPSGFDEWFARATSPRREDRFGSAMQQMQSLQRLCRGFSGTGDGGLSPDEREPDFGGATAVEGAAGLVAPAEPPSARLARRLRSRAGFGLSLGLLLAVGWGLLLAASETGSPSGPGDAVDPMASLALPPDVLRLVWRDAAVAPLDEAVESSSSRALSTVDAERVAPEIDLPSPPGEPVGAASPAGDSAGAPALRAGDALFVARARRTGPTPGPSAPARGARGSPAPAPAGRAPASAPEPHPERGDGLTVSGRKIRTAL